MLLELTSKEHHRWHDWFIEHEKAWDVPFATGRMATIGRLVLHIFGVELRYAQRLLDQDVTAWEDFQQASIEEVFALAYQYPAHYFRHDKGLPTQLTCLSLNDRNQV